MSSCPPPNQSGSHLTGPPNHMPSFSIHRLEATGIVVIAILLLILTLIRYWRYIPWSAR